MGDAQSAPREAKSDAAAEEESGEVEDVQSGHVEDKVLKNNGQISDINIKAEDSTVALNGHCEEEIAIEGLAAICPEIKVSEPPKEEETLLENEDIIKKAAEETEDKPLGDDDLIEIDAKQNDINESFKKFFSNIGLKLTVKRGSTDKGEVTADVSGEEQSKPEDVKVEGTPNEITEEAQDNTDINSAEEAMENDSIMFQTLTDVTPDEDQKKEDEDSEKTKEEITTQNAGTSSPLSEDVTPQEEPRPASPADLDETASPFKKFFTTGIFSGLRKKKKLEDGEVGEKELVEGEQNKTKAPRDQQPDQDVTAGVDEAKAEKVEEEKPNTKSATAPSIVVDEITNSQEIVQESPLRRLLSGSSFKKLSKRQKSRKSSDAKLSDSGEHISDQLQSSAESAENRKVETHAEAVSGEDGAWFSFKKLVTPQKKKKSVDHEEGPISGSKDEVKSGEGEQISDHSTEEGKRRKDSSVSWEAVLCGSGRRRSRKTSDSEEETPLSNEGNKQNGGSKEAPQGTSNEMQEDLASSPKQTEEDEGSTWRSFKKLVTPKRKVKEEEESTSEVGQDDSAFSIKRLLSGRKTSKSVDVPADEVGKEDAIISDEDSETPAVVPLSEFDLIETQTEAEKESNIAKDAASEPQMDIVEIKEEVQSQDIVPTEAKDAPKDEGALEKEVPSVAATDEEPDELTESSSNQQLSDIPEEGVLTETTPASVAEEAAKDETIAEDLLEFTSEAITAPEQADVTIADETEMVSAVSQLSESSKTSGNTTPVPADYDVMNTESLLLQVSQTISISPKTIPVCLEKLSPERVVGSVSHQILESPMLDHPKILEIHRGSEATCMKTGLNAKGIDPVNEVTATAQAESISHLSEVISTEMASEVPKEELDTAEPFAGGVCEIHISEIQQDIKDLQITSEMQHVAEDTGDVEEVESNKSLLKEVTATEEVKAGQIENNERKTDQEEELPVTSADDTREAIAREFDQAVAEETKEKTSEQAQNEPLPPAGVDEKEELTRAETAEVTSGESDIQSNEERSRENIQLTEAPSQDLTEETKEKEEPQTFEAKTDQSTEAKQVIKIPAVELGEDLLQTFSTDVSVSENITTAEIDISESKPIESPPESTGEAEKKDPQTYQSEVTVEVESVQTPMSESEEDAAHSLNKEVSVSDDLAAETDAEDYKQVESLIEVTKDVEMESPQTVTGQTDGSKVTEVFENVQAPTTVSEVDAVQSLHGEVSSFPDSSPAKTQLDPFAEVKNELEDTEPKSDKVQIYQSEVTEGFESVQAATLEPQKDEVVFLNKEVSLLDISPAETEESKQVDCLTEVSDGQNKKSKTDAAQTDSVELTEELKSLDMPIVTSEEEQVQSLNKNTEADKQDQKPEETNAREDQEPKTGAAQMEEALTCAQTPTINSEKDAVHSLDQAMFSENIASAVINTEKPELLKSMSEIQEEQRDNEGQATIPPLEPSEVTQVSEVKEVTDIVQELTDVQEASDIQQEAKDVVQKAINLVQATDVRLKATDVVQEGTDVQQKATDVVQEATNLVQATDVQQKATDVVQEATDGVQEGTAVQQEATDVVQKGIDVVQEATNVVQEGTDVQQEATDVQQEATDVVQEDKDVQQEATDVQQEATNVRQEATDVVQEGRDAQQEATDVVKEATHLVQATDVHLKATEVVQEATDVVQEATDVVQEGTDVVQEATDVVQEATNVVQEGTDVQQEATDVVQEATNLVQATDVQQKATDVVQEATDVVQEATNIVQKDTDVQRDSQEALLELEENRVEVLEKDITPYDTVPKAETDEGKPKEKLECPPQGTIQAEDAPKAEPEANAALSFDTVSINSETSDVGVLYESSTVEAVTDKLIFTESKEPPSAELKASPPSVQEIASGLETCQPTTAPSDEESKTQELERQITLQHVPQPEVKDNGPEEPEGKAIRQLDQETDTKPCDPKIEHEENVLEDVEGLQALTAVHISLINEDPKSAEVLEKTTCLEKTICVDLAEVSEEPKNEVNLCEHQENVDGEKVCLLSNPELKVATTDHTIISHEVMSNLQGVLAEKPSVVVREALMDNMVSETELNDKIETATLLVQDDINQGAEPSIAAVSVRVPPVEIEVNHKVQVYLMNVDIRSAQNAVDTVIQVGVTEDKEVIDVCHESVQKVQNLSATAGIEEETTTEEIHVKVQDINPSTLATQIVEQVIRQSETFIEVCEMEKKKSVGTEDVEVANDCTKMILERQEDKAVITENSEISAEQNRLKESEIPSIIPQIPDISIEDHKEDVEEVKAVESEVFTSATDVPELAGKGPNDSTVEPLPSTQRQIAKAGNAGLAVPQNTSVMSTVGNVEPPSSLSLEFKLNIQFAQSKASMWPSTVPTERTEPAKQVDVSDTGVQAEESAEPVHQEDEYKKHREVNEVAVQATSLTEPDTDSHLAKRAVITSQPVLQEVGIQAVEIMESVEQIQSTERAVPKVQAVEASQRARQERRAVLLSKPRLCEVKKGWAFRQSEDENDQEVWLDAEEDIYPLQETQMSTDKVDEHVQLWTENEQKDEADSNLEFAMACSQGTEDTESKRAVLKKETCEIESEGEDFAVALEELGTSVSAVE